MVKKVLLLGPSGIGKAHLRELIKLNFSNIYLLGKKFKKDRVKNLKFKFLKNSKLFNLKNIHEIKKKKFNLINICSPTDLHYKHIKFFKNFSNSLLVEKPLLWIKKRNISNYKLSKKILTDSRTKIFVNLPMISLANQLKQKQKISRVKNFSFNYFTNGKKTYDDIAVDLLPHALSFFFQLTKNTFKNIDIAEVSRERFKWKCKINIDNCDCVFSFKQNIQKKNSQLSFRINDDLYLRKQVKVGNSYNFKLIKNKKKIIRLKNPMSDYLRHIIKSSNSKLSLKNNNQITIMSVKVSEKLINFK